MLIRRKASSLGGGGIGIGLGTGPAKCVTAYKSASSSTTRSKLFQPGSKLIVQRAPAFCGLSVQASTSTSSVHSKFQRPMTKRRSYDKGAEAALQKSSLGPKRRMNGMAKLLARAGRGLTFQLPVAKLTTTDGNDTGDESDSEEDENKEPDRPFEPLCVWTSPHQGAEPNGLTPRTVTEMRADEYGVEEQVTVLRPAPTEAYSKENVFVPPVLAKWLRPHQREGVQFMYECVMGLRDFAGNGCILADDMGLGKTLQSVCLILTLLKTGITAGKDPTCKRILVICPCSLVKNWENEFIKWLGPGVVKTLALAEADRKTVEKNIDIFVKTKMFNVLIASYECVRAHVSRFTKHADCCDLLVCDEAHRLKNSDNQTSRALNSLPVKRRVLLTGTPMQNDLQEFYAMVDFTNPGILGTPEEFRRKTLFPILRGREPDASDAQKRKMMEIQNDMSTTVNDFILRRVNTLNAEHLPPKLVQVVCCNLTEIQQNMYQHLVTSKDMQHALDGKQVNCLASIQMLMKLSNHPSLVVDADKNQGGGGSKRTAGSKTIKYADDDIKETTAAPGAGDIAKFLPFAPGAGGGRRGDFAPIHPEWSGKMFVLFRLMKEMRRPGNGNDKIVIISNYTQTLDLIGRMCREHTWGFCRLDGSVTMKKRQKMVDEFNDPNSPLVAFLLSSKAGGCGLNLIGGNRLVLFDPDWNPAVDKQAAARCWRDGQKKRCFTYRFLATGTVEEKIFQRQLSKEGLQSVVDDKEQVNTLSTKDLKNLFKLRSGTPSDTHDKLRCERCKIIHDNAEMEAKKVLPRQLVRCRELLDLLRDQDDAKHFLKPLDATEHGSTKENYEKFVKQPMDMGSILGKLEQPPEHPAAYSSISGLSKDVNRIFSNVMKVWSPGDEIADASRRLQVWWYDQWTEVVPSLMNMKACDDDDEEKSEKDSDSDPVDAALESCANMHHERGDNYQEQIGMPDEENMRHWSHHHSTDTVDDPVFRTAMKGYDSVSFVFGLEVTWSLIQERQQEEEMRAAMKEMEKMQGDDENENDDDNAGGEDSKPAALASKECEPDNALCDSDSDSDNGGGEDVAVQEEENGEDDSDSDNGGGQDVAVQEEEDDSDSDNGGGDDVVAQEEEDEDGEDDSSSGSEDSEKQDEDVVLVDTDTPRGSPVKKRDMAGMDSLATATIAPPSTSGKSTPYAEAEIADDSSPESSCDTSIDAQIFVSHHSHHHADHEESSVDASTQDTNTNSNASSQQAGAEKENTASAASPNEWACSTCTLHNKKSLRKCGACGTKKPRQQTKKRSIAELDNNTTE